jgi:hypothetical protein
MALTMTSHLAISDHPVPLRSAGRRRGSILGPFPSRSSSGKRRNSWSELQQPPHVIMPHARARFVPRRVGQLDGTRALRFGRKHGPRLSAHALLRPDAEALTLLDARALTRSAAVTPNTHVRSSGVFGSRRLMHLEYACVGEPVQSAFGRAWSTPAYGCVRVVPACPGRRLVDGELKITDSAPVVPALLVDPLLIIEQQAGTAGTAGTRGHESRARRGKRLKTSDRVDAPCPRWCSLGVPSAFDAARR